MQILTSHPQNHSRSGQVQIPRTACLAVGVLLLLGSGYAALRAQDDEPRNFQGNRISRIAPGPTHVPDENALMTMNMAKRKKENFDAANALRERQINDEAVKLLILAKDLKLQMDKLGDKPLPDRLLREAEVIELLAHDVQTKMTLTIKGG
jgi:hypothetical protein